ncbi:MAG: Hsp20/alpha crystallin family protein [Clostridiaceae bacterium]|nr:Hsp20/alpha crystallin family protein [Clostridiaceae bacterium]
MLPSIFGENLFDDFFDDAFERNFFNSDKALYGKRVKNLMKTDVKEGKNGYEIAVDLPGFKKEDINVELNNGYLTVSVSKGLNRDEEDKEGRYIRHERYSGTCSRSFYVGDIKSEDIQGKYDSGVLRLSIPKKDQKAIVAPNRIAIE